MKQAIYHQLEYSGKNEFSSCVYAKAELCPSSHFHKNFEILIVMQGSCVCTVDGNQYVLNENEAIVFLPFQIHSFSVMENSVARCTVFHEHLILTLAQSIEGKKPEVPVFHPTEGIRAFFLSQMAFCFGEDSGMQKRISPAFKRMKVKGCLYMIAGEFLEQATFVPISVGDTVAMNVLQFISNNFRRDISLKDIANSTGYNYQYLSRMFNQIFGKNFKKILNQYRLEYAYALLQDTQLSVSEISFESGFQSIRSFDHVCQETFHKSPLKLRQEALAAT